MKSCIFILAGIIMIPIACEQKPDQINLQKAEKMTESAPINKTDEQWKQQLTPEQYKILRKKGTEAPFTGKYDTFFEDGAYYCAACGNKLFESDNKYNSGCGWPAFDSPADPNAVTESLDTSLNRVRTEITCSKCGSHLGHVFEDGPKQTTGLRYCINSAAINFEKEQEGEPRN